MHVLGITIDNEGGKLAVSIVKNDGNITQTVNNVEINGIGLTVSESVTMSIDTETTISVCQDIETENETLIINTN